MHSSLCIFGFSFCPLNFCNFSFLFNIGVSDFTSFYLSQIDIKRLDNFSYIFIEICSILFAGALGLIWTVVWWFLVYETPLVHPKITPREKKYLEVYCHLKAEKGKKPPFPFLKVATSLPFMATIVAHFVFNWGYYRCALISFDVHSSQYTVHSTPGFRSSLNLNCVAIFSKAKVAIRKLFSVLIWSNVHVHEELHMSCVACWPCCPNTSITFCTSNCKMYASIFGKY